jgi:hypothetical protein
VAGRGPAPKANRQRPRDEKRRARGAPKVTKGVGWQYGARPKPPAGLMPASKTTWSTWFSSWYAANWTPSDLPQLRVAIRIFDQVERGEFTRTQELRLWCDTLGITPKGQQDRRWKPPEVEAGAEPIPDYYGGLKAVE